MSAYVFTWVFKDISPFQGQQGLLLLLHLALAQLLAVSPLQRLVRPRVVRHLGLVHRRWRLEDRLVCLWERHRSALWAPGSLQRWHLLSRDLVGEQIEQAYSEFCNSGNRAGSADARASISNGRQVY